MKELYHICFLGYGNLVPIVQQVIDSLEFEDTIIHYIESQVDNIHYAIDSAVKMGYEVFVTRGSNAAEFARYSHAHLIELAITDVDYLLAIQEALKIGSKPAIATYRHMKPLNLENFSRISGIDIGYIPFEDGKELKSLLLSSDYDVIVGASYVNEIADSLGKKHVFLQTSTESIRQTFLKARTLAKRLKHEQQASEITRSIINNSPFGIMVTDNDDLITLCNAAMQNYIGLSSFHLRGKSSSDLIPNLAVDKFLAGESDYLESYKIINGVRVRCTQIKLKNHSQDIGVLTFFHINNTRAKGEQLVSLLSPSISWKHFIARSPHMQQLVKTGKYLSRIDSPISIYGEYGVGKKCFAHCIHTGSNRVNKLCVTLDLTSYSANDAGRILLGYEDNSTINYGVIEQANGGTIILQNLAEASPAVQSILAGIIKKKNLVRLGGITPVSVNIRFIALFSDENAQQKIRQDLYYLFTVFKIQLPPLRERPEDIAPLFKQIFEQTMDNSFVFPFSDLMDEILRSYSWPGNIHEMVAVSERMASMLHNRRKPTVQAMRLILLRSLNEERLFDDIQRQYRIKEYMANPKGDPESFLKGVQTIQKLLNWNYAKIAAGLGVSRTTLWRHIKNCAKPSPAAEPC